MTPPLSCLIRTNIMTDQSARVESRRIEAARLDDRGHVTYRARCPFCAATVIDRDNNAAGCWHAKELDHSRDGSHFIFERPTA